MSFYKAHKFNAKKTIVDGIAFPSQLEASVFKKLKEQEALGFISDIKLQASVRLKDKCEHCGSAAVTWKVDFRFIDENGKERYAEAKGAETPDFKKRKKLWKTLGPAPLEIWKGSWRYPKVVEIVEPKGSE